MTCQNQTELTSLIGHVSNVIKTVQQTVGICTGPDCSGPKIFLDCDGAGAASASAPGRKRRQLTNGNQSVIVKFDLDYAISEQTSTEFKRALRVTKLARPEFNETYKCGPGAEMKGTDCRKYIKKFKKKSDSEI